MELGVENLIHPKVHRAIYPYAIKRFLEDNVDELESKITEYNIDISDEYKYSRILDSVVNNNDIDSSLVDNFLINEFNYGRMRNVYVSFISDVSHLKNEDNVIRYLNSLNNKGYKNSEEVTCAPFIKNIRKGIQKGEEELIFFDNTKEGEEIKNIRIVFAQSIINEEGNESNNYIAVEINLEHKFLVIKIRNWENNNEQNYSMDTLNKLIQDDIKQAFHLSIPLATSTTQQLVYNMVNELSGKVLNQAVNEVNEKVSELVKSQVVEWSKKILSEEVTLPISDHEVVVQSILNNYYRIYMQNEIGVLKVGKLKEKFEVDGYPRYVKFIDDTIGEGRARSSDPKESLLDTSIFYDIKARLDQAKQIKIATIYWIDSPGYDYLGTSFYTDSQERFKFVVLANFFNKEICDYVLRQISKYRPAH
jgi:hypothetical protein